MSSAAETINTVSRWLDYLLAIPMIVFGMIGALLTVLVFAKHRTFWRNPTINYLLAGGVMTAIHLPSIYLTIILVDGFGLSIFNSTDAACRLFNYFLYVTTVSAISFPCWAAFDQYASTCREAAFRNRWSSMRVVRLAIVGTVIFWIIFYLPIFFISGIANNVCLLTDSSYTKFNNYALTPLVFVVIPLVLIISFTQGTIRNLRSTIVANRNDRLTKQIRRMLIPQLFVLGISGFPFGLESVYLEATGAMQKSDLRMAIEHITLQILRFFFHINFVCTFYIYLYMSSEVRQTLKRLIGRCFHQNTVVPIPLINNNNNTNTMKNINTLQTLNSTNHA